MEDPVPLAARGRRPTTRIDVPLHAHQPVFRHRGSHWREKRSAPRARFHADDVAVSATQPAFRSTETGQVHIGHGKRARFTLPCGSDSPDAGLRTFDVRLEPQREMAPDPGAASVDICRSCFLVSPALLRRSTVAGGSESSGGRTIEGLKPAPRGYGEGLERVRPRERFKASDAIPTAIEMEGSGCPTRSRW